MTKRRVFTHRDSHQHAAHIADTVAETWGRSASGGSDLEVPAGVLAALALAPHRLDPDGPDPADLMDVLPRAEFIDLLRQIWVQFAIVRPDLSPTIGPIRNWLWQDRSDYHLAAAHDVGRAALRAGILDLCADDHRRRSVDVFGNLLQAMRPKSAITGRGQFYTPHEVSSLMARMLDITPGMTVMEPAVGTGGMFCAAAEVLREQGHDPATVTWYAADIDPLAVACLSVNAHLWDLGPRVLFTATDTLRNPDWIPDALRARDSALFEINALRMITRVNQLTTPTPEHAAPLAA